MHLALRSPTNPEWIRIIASQSFTGNLTLSGGIFYS